MAGAKLTARIRRGRVPGSSILEVVISMVIIIVVLGIALGIYTNVTRLSLSGQQLRAQAVLDKAMITIRHHPHQELSLDSLAPGWKLEQERKPYEAGSPLQQVHLTLYDGNQTKIGELQQIIISHEDTTAAR